MEELKVIYRDLQDIYLHYSSLQSVLNRAEISEWEEEGEDTALFLHFSAYYLNAVQNEMRKVIQRLDEYLLSSSGDSSGPYRL